MIDHNLSKPDIRQANDCPPLPANASAFDRLVYWLGIGLGSGLPRRAPGTWGTVGALIVAIPLLSLGFVPFLMITILACLLGNAICGRTSELMGGHDNPHIVWDEWAGMWLTLLPLSYMGIANGSFWQNITQIPRPPATFLSAQPIGGGLIMSKKRNNIKAIIIATIVGIWMIFCQKLPLAIPI